MLHLLCHGTAPPASYFENIYIAYTLCEVPCLIRQCIYIYMTDTDPPSLCHTECRQQIIKLVQLFRLRMTEVKVKQIVKGHSKERCEGDLQVGAFGWHCGTAVKAGTSDAEFPYAKASSQVSHPRPPHCPRAQSF